MIADMFDPATRKRAALYYWPREFEKTYVASDQRGSAIASSICPGLKLLIAKSAASPKRGWS